MRSTSEGPCPAKGASHDGRLVMYTHQDKVMARSSDKFRTGEHLFTDMSRSVQ